MLFRESRGCAWLHASESSAAAIMASAPAQEYHAVENEALRGFYLRSGHRMGACQTKTLSSGKTLLGDMAICPYPYAGVVDKEDDTSMPP